MSVDACRNAKFRLSQSQAKYRLLRTAKKSRGRSQQTQPQLRLATRIGLVTFTLVSLWASWLRHVPSTQTHIDAGASTPLSH